MVGPAVATVTLPLDQVRIGMKGYGLSVFHGDRIEPFAVEVISVMKDFVPGKGVIWVRCPDDRMQKSGPVQGMSGSPIYLWGENEQAELGKGGRLIGAFAFGFAATKDCYVGIQPIELMREVGEGAGSQWGSGAGGGAGDSSPVPAAMVAGTLRELLAAADRLKESPDKTWRGRAIASVLLRHFPSVDVYRGAREFPAGPQGFSGRVVPMMLPVTVHSQGLISAYGWVFESMGLAPVASAPGMIAGLPPKEIDAGKIKLEPGSVLSIPLAFGDMDLSASGTVTDVLPDGRVLAFGHAMFGQGEAALPMSTGFVHYVVPGLVNSFKLGGSAVIRGSIVRDENSGIVGVPRRVFRTAPVTLTVRRAGHEARKYRYQVVHHKALTPLIVATVGVESLNAEANLPQDNTVHVHGQMVFAGGRRLRIDSRIPGASDQSVMYDLVAPLAAMIQNEHESVMLESMEFEVDIESKVRSSAITTGRLDRSELSPGDTLGITIKMQPYGQKAVSRRIEFTIPQHLDEGAYSLVVCDAQTYQRMLFQMRPHLMNTANIDDVFSVIQQVMSIPSDALFVILQLPDQGLAIGRDELPQLPSSRKAMIASPTSTAATPFGVWAEKKISLDTVSVGQLGFTISVKKDIRQER